MSDTAPLRDVTCKEFLDFLAAYLAGELPATTVAEFERHLAICPSCVTYIETYRQTIALSRGAARAAEEEATAADLPEDLVAAILAARREEA